MCMMMEFYSFREEACHIYDYDVTVVLYVVYVCLVLSIGVLAVCNGGVSVVVVVIEILSIDTLCVFDNGMIILS